MGFWTRMVTGALATLMLTGCLLTPGKFDSTLDIRADRSFTFTYVGEVHAIEPEDMNGLNGGEADDAAGLTAADKADRATDRAAKRAKRDEQHRAVAEALRGEPGYRLVEYRGNDLFFIDYRVAGTLNHAFIFPFNSDAEILFPFLAIELRPGGAVRVKAPGFAQSAGGIPGALDAAMRENNRLDGRFTLTSDAEVVSQNTETGVTRVGADSRMAWRITPRTLAAPMAILRLGR